MAASAPAVPVAAVTAATAARSRSRTSSSVVWVKSQYDRPTARNGEGVVAQTTSSTISASSWQVDCGATGTATTIVPGRCRRSASIAARMLAPVARPSSTRITVLPARSGMGRPSR